MFELEGKCALITGASGGIGGSIARALYGQGAKVALSGTRIDPLKALADDLGDRAFIVPCNLSDVDAVKALPQKASEEMGGIDILVNNAGITKDNLFMRMSDDDWHQVIDINLTSTMHLMKSVMRTMMKKRFGRIINISSVAGQYHGPFTAHYAISKAGLISFTKFIARYSAKDNIYCNALCPGLIRTDQTLDEFETTGNDIINMTLLKREGTYNDIRSSIKFLLDENQKYYTGQTINLSGGAIL